MFTNKRLDQAYDRAHTMTFGDEDKFIILSDVHRGDNSISDEFAHNQNIYLHALNHYYNAGFTYIENGDGDELWEHSKLKHIRFAHTDIFEAMKAFHDDNRFLLLYGNHNMQYKSKAYVRNHLYKCYDLTTDQEVDLFPKIDVHEAIRLHYQVTGQELFIVHGHQGDFFNDQAWLFSLFWLRFFWRFFHVIGFRNPASPAKSQNKRHKIERKYVRWIKHSHHLLIVGHTHRPKFSYPEDPVPYFNSGSCVRPRNITGLEIENGAISLIEWRIWPDDQGQLRILRRVTHGPIPLQQYIGY